MKSFTDHFLDERSSVALLICVASGACLVGLVTHFFAPPVWISVMATFAWVLVSPLILRFMRRGRTTEHHGRPVGLIVASIAAVTVSIVLTSGVNVDSAHRVIMTWANDQTTERLPDGTVLALDALSTVRVNITAQQRGARLMEGEVIFNVPQDATKPFVVETVAATVTAAGGKFRIGIDSSVEIEVFEGLVQVTAPGARAGAPARILRKGDGVYRVPLDRPWAMAANGRGPMGARLCRWTRYQAQKHA